MKKEIDECGTIRYYNENNELHREDGPAVESASGDNCWYKNGKLHREDGPAIEYRNGNKYYWYNGINYSEIKTDEEWIRFIKLIVLFVSIIDVSRIDIKTCSICDGEISSPTNSKQVRSAGLDPYMFWIYGCKNDITHMIKIFIDCNICDIGICFWEFENGNMMNLIIKKDNINCLYLKDQKGNDIGSIDIAGLMIDDNLIKKIKGMLIFK